MKHKFTAEETRRNLAAAIECERRAGTSLAALRMVDSGSHGHAELRKEENRVKAELQTLIAEYHDLG